MAESKFSFDLLKNKVVGKSGKVDTDAALNGKHVMLYFSAHWCPPCRGFTPKLIEFYNKHHEDKDFEIIFISSDRDEKSFNDYFKYMPFLALDYKERDTKDKIANHFGIKGIPTLILLNSDGSVANANARADVTNDPDGFPWKKE